MNEGGHQSRGFNYYHIEETLALLTSTRCWGSTHSYCEHFLRLLVQIITWHNISAPVVAKNILRGIKHPRLQKNNGLLNSSPHSDPHLSIPSLPFISPSTVWSLITRSRGNHQPAAMGGMCSVFRCGDVDVNTPCFWVWRQHGCFSSNPQQHFNGPNTSCYDNTRGWKRHQRWSEWKGFCFWKDVL